jgi:hypothetical protein
VSRGIESPTQYYPQRRWVPHTWRLSVVISDPANHALEEHTFVVLQRIRKYAREYQQEHNSSCDKALAEAVRLLELETY